MIPALLVDCFIFLAIYLCTNPLQTLYTRISGSTHSECIDFVCSADVVKTFPLLRSVICILNSDGSVMCMPPYNHVVTCSADLRRWPYDTHTCVMTTGSWTHTARQIRISLMEPGVRTESKDICVITPRAVYFSVAIHRLGSECQKCSSVF